MKVRRSALAVRAAALAVAALPAWAGAPSPGLIEEDAATRQPDGPIVSGPGGSFAARQRRVAGNAPTLNAEPPVGGPDAGTKGAFGPVIAWPSVPIHMVLTPDGRVMNFGATSTGKQGGDLDYAVWDPSLGTGAEAFDLLPNTTEVNTFCAGQWLLPQSGKVLITGGTEIRGNIRGIGIEDTTIYSPRTDKLTKTTSMLYRRWYATTIGTSSGEVVALGGRIDPNDITHGPITAAGTPEAYNPATKTWRVLTGAASDTAYGARYYSWFYPRAWLAPGGDTFIITHDGSTYGLSTEGLGSIRMFTERVPPENSHMGSAMYAPGKIMSIRDDRKVALIDINGATPVVSEAAPISRHRRYGNATLLPTGQVWVNGGVAADDNVLEGSHLESEIWDPASNQWRNMASATIPRLYHSSALLLPDGSVLTGGGGLPGPLTNMNGEIYYPPYFYKKDGSGQAAPRPRINTKAIGLTWGQPFSVNLTSGKPIVRVTLLGSGMVTHTFNNGQRFQELPFTVSGGKLRLTAPTSRTITPAGFYLMYAIDADGVPSEGKMLRITG